MSRKGRKNAEFTDFCRLCLAIGRELDLLNPEDDNDELLLEASFELLDLRLQRSLVIKICRECISLLKLFKTFKETTKAAQEVFIKHAVRENLEAMPTLLRPAYMSKLKPLVEETHDILQQSSRVSVDYYKMLSQLSSAKCKQETGVKVKEEPFEVKSELEFFQVTCEPKLEEMHEDDVLRDGDDTEDEAFAGKGKKQKGKYKVHECEICHKKFDGYDIKYHMNVHLKIYPFKCDQCDRKFAYPARLSSHKKSDHKLGESDDFAGGNLPCEACGKLFSRKKLWDHQKKFHREIHKCEECDETFPNFFKLSKHQKKSHFNPPLQKYTCELCGKAFRKTRLKYHMNIHMNIRPFVCDYEGCDKACPDPGQLAVHKRIIHLKTIKITCKICNKPFKTKADHDIHFTYHGEPSLPCQVCGRLLMNRKTLAKHMLTHTGEKKYICKFEGCAKNFTNSTGLTVHIRSHTKEKPYSCDCGEKFTYRIGLRRHSEKVHGKII